MSEEVSSAMVIHELRESLKQAVERAERAEAELAMLRNIAEIAFDYVDARSDSYGLEISYEALEQAARRWKASKQ